MAHGYAIAAGVFFAVPFRWSMVVFPCNRCACGFRFMGKCAARHEKNGVSNDTPFLLKHEEWLDSYARRRLRSRREAMPRMPMAAVAGSGTTRWLNVTWSHAFDPSEPIA